MGNWNVTFGILFVFEIDASVWIRILVGSGHVWICGRTGIRMMRFVSDSDAQAWIRVRVGCDRVHVRIRVRVGFLLSVGFILVSDSYSI